MAMVSNIQNLISSTEFSKKKTIVASKEIKKGEKFSRENLIFIRNMEKEGIQPIFLNKIINRRAKKRIKKFETLKLNYL